MSRSTDWTLPDCLTCANWLPKKTPPAMARLGLSICSHGKSYEYLPHTASCKKHQPVSLEIQATREKWIKDKK